MVLSKVLGVWGSASPAGEAEMWEWDKKQARSEWDLFSWACGKPAPAPWPERWQGAGLGVSVNLLGALKCTTLFPLKHTSTET